MTRDGEQPGALTDEEYAAIVKAANGIEDPVQRERTLEVLFAATRAGMRVSKAVKAAETMPAVDPRTLRREAAEALQEQDLGEDVIRNVMDWTSDADGFGG